MNEMKKIQNPLTIIGGFAGIAEVAGTVVLPFVAEELQKYFIWYVMIFPVFLVALFFATLNKNPKVLYAPSDFKDEDNFMKLITDATVALDNIIDTNPSFEKDLKPVVNLIEKIPVTDKRLNIVTKLAMGGQGDDSGVVGKLKYARGEINLEKKEILIGRDIEADIVIRSHKVSRRHCEIFEKNAMFYIRDLDSTNGTYVNGKMIGKIEELEDKDIIKIGDVQMEFELGRTL